MRFGDLFEWKGLGDDRPKGKRGQSIKDKSFGCTQSRRIASSSACTLRDVRVVAIGIAPIVFAIWMTASPTLLNEEISCGCR